MEYGNKEFIELLENYRKGKSWLNDVSIEIEGGENNLDPLILLRAYEAEPTVDNSMSLASQFVMNKHVVFKRGGVDIFAFTYTGGELSQRFTNFPYLLDLLLKLSYGLMVKKLTPPSESSETDVRP